MNQLTDQQGNPISIASIEEWEEKRAGVLEAMQEVMGPLPGQEKRCDLDVKVEEEVDCGTYVRRLISYASEPDARTPAYLLIPKRAIEQEMRLSAVLCPHPTDNRIGHKVVVGLGEKANRSYASELAQRGFGPPQGRAPGL